MSDKQILNIPKQLNKAGVSGDVLLQWHGGEPLLIEPTRCAQLIVGLNRLGLGFKIHFLHGIQTNLVVLNGFSKAKRNQWHQVLSQYFDPALIGVSWDKAIRGINLKPQHKFYHDFEQTIHAISHSGYFKEDFAPNITITAAKPFLTSMSNLGYCTLFFKWLDDRNLSKIHLEKLTPTGDAIKHWKQIGVSNLEYSNTMSKLYLTYQHYREQNPSSPLAISPFCDLEDGIKTGRQDNVCASGLCQSSMLTATSEGLIKTCTAIADIKRQYPDGLNIYQNSVKTHCAQCEFNNLCAGGCPAHHSVVDGSGECGGAKKLLRTIKHTTVKQTTKQQLKQITT